MKNALKILLPLILILLSSNFSYAVTKIWCVGTHYGQVSNHPLPGAKGFDSCPGKTSNKVKFDKVAKHYSSGEGKKHLCNMLDGSDFNNPNLKVWFELAVEIKVKCKENLINDTKIVIKEDKETKKLTEQEKQKPSSNIKNCSSCQFQKMSNETICVGATTKNEDSIIVWEKNTSPIDFTKYVVEAKKRGLHCNVNKREITTASKKSNEESNKLSGNRKLISLLDSTICYFATVKIDEIKIWNTSRMNFLKEANYRGLDCGVIDNKTVVDSSTNTQTLTTNAELEKAKSEAEVLRNKLAALEKKQKEQQKTIPKTIVTNKPKSEFPLKPIPINFPSISVKRDDIAVIIGNADYKKQGKDISNVNPAYADAEGIKQYFMKSKGIKEGNIIYLKDATGAQLLGVFGNEKSHKGKLFNYIKPNKSNVYIYYAGHGAPGKEGDAYLVPTDTDSQTIEFTGYPLSTLYSNLGKLPAKSMTVILEACFSGGSQSGSLISRASPIVIQPKKTFIPNNIKVIAAGSERQMASWEEDSSHSLFTKYFLKAMSGEGDFNKDGKVSDKELKEYLSDTMTYYARRYYGRDQKVQIHNGG